MTIASIPLAIAITADLLITTMDIIMVGWLGQTELAALGVAGALFNVLMLFVFGVGAMASAMLAQAIAQNNHTHTQNTVYGIVVTGIISIALCMIMFINPTGILNLMGQDPAVVTLASDFLQVRIPAVAFICFVSIYRSFLQTLGLQKYTTVIYILALPLNGFFNYVFIFGNFGVPAMGVVGAAIASNITNGITVLILFTMFKRQTVTAPLKSFVGLLSTPRDVVMHTFKTTLPMSLANTAEMLFWSGTTFLVGLLGVQALATHQMSVAIAYALIGPYIAFGIVVSIEAGKCAGLKQARQLNDLLKIGTLFPIVYAGFCLILVSIALPPLAPRIFQALPPESIQLGLSGMVIFVFIQCFYGMYECKMGILRGINDTRSLLVITVVTFVILGLLVVYALSQYFGLWGVWYGMLVAVCITVLSCYIRFTMISKSPERLFKNVRYADDT